MVNNVKIGDAVTHSNNEELQAIVVSEHSTNLWNIKYTAGPRKGKRGSWMKTWTQPLPHVLTASDLIKRGGIREAQRYSDLILEQMEKYTHPALVIKDSCGNLSADLTQLSEEDDMQFTTVQKKLMVDGVDLLSVDEQSLMNFITDKQAKVKEIEAVEFESERLNREVDTLNKLIKKAIKLMDAID